MRIVLVGRQEDRDRLREGFAEAGIEIAGEAPTLAAARAAGVEGDAFVLAAPGADVDGGFDGVAVADEPLTPREIEVLELLAEGLPNKAIAARLAISDQTVKFHVASITGKLGARNRTDAVRRAVRRGLIAL